MKITGGIGGTYYIHDNDDKIIEIRARVMTEEIARQAIFEDKLRRMELLSLEFKAQKEDL